jgi:hypothetical protein
MVHTMAPRLAGALMLALTLAAPARAADDALLAVRARAALHGDADLAERNLAVHVSDGVATLRGDVHSAAEADRAVALVRQVPQVTDVQSLLRVVKPRAPAFVLPKEDDPPTLADTAVPDRSPGRLGELTVYDNERLALPPPPTEPVWPQAPPRLVLPAEPPQVTEEPQPQPQQNTTRPVVVVSLHAPVPADELTPAPLWAEEDLTGALRRLRRGDPTRRVVQVEQSGGTLWVRGPVTSADAVWAVAQGLRESHLPGVERVVVRLTR